MKPYRKFLLDENVDYRLVSLFTELGHDVTAIAYDYPLSIADHDVLKIAVQEQRILITNDRDFGELIFRLKHDHCGVIYFHLKKGDLSISTLKEKIHYVLREHVRDLAHFITVTSTKIKVRKGERKKTAA